MGSSWSEEPAKRPLLNCLTLGIARAIFPTDARNVDNGPQALPAFIPAKEPSCLWHCTTGLADRFQGPTWVVEEGVGEKACVPKPLLWAPPAECTPLLVLPNVDGPKGSADALLSCPNVGSDMLQRHNNNCLCAFLLHGRAWTAAQAAHEFVWHS